MLMILTNLSLTKGMSRPLTDNCTIRLVQLLFKQPLEDMPVLCAKAILFIYFSEGDRKIAFAVQTWLVAHCKKRITSQGLQHWCRWETMASLPGFDILLCFP